jgi:AbiU2
MTDTTEQIYDQVHQQVARLHAYWKILDQLYATAQRRQLLDNMAPAFFGIVEESLTESVFMILSRLTDPAETRRGRNTDQNLSLARLVESVQDADSEFNQAIDTTLRGIQQHCRVFRDWRNRVIAHADQPTAFQIRPLPTILQEEVEQALLLIRRLMHQIEHHRQKGDVRYEDVILHGDGDTIVFFLQQAEEYDNEQRDRVLRGE